MDVEKTGNLVDLERDLINSIVCDNFIKNESDVEKDEVDGIIKDTFSLLMNIINETDPTILEKLTKTFLVAIAKKLSHKIINKTSIDKVIENIKFPRRIYG